MKKKDINARIHNYLGLDQGLPMAILLKEEIGLEKILFVI